MKILKRLFDKYKIPYTEQMLNQLGQYYQMVIQTNKQFNLTAITDEDEFAIKHILDSVLPNQFLPLNATVIDIGAGAGFPSIPLKIIRPDLQITMIDSLNKRVNFLNEVIKKLELDGTIAVHARAEDYAVNFRGQFDVAIARAVAPLCTLAEYCLPFVKIGGVFIAMKGGNLQEELVQAQNAILLLGGERQTTQEVVVEEIDAKRLNLIVKKIKPTPTKYPRGKNQPRLKPLV